MSKKITLGTFILKNALHKISTIFHCQVEFQTKMERKKDTSNIVEVKMLIRGLQSP